MKDFFPRLAVCEFIQMNRRSASFESWVYHFKLNNPLSACISYSNKLVKRERDLKAELVEKDVWLCRLLFLFGL